MPSSQVKSVQRWLLLESRENRIVRKQGVLIYFRVECIFPLDDSGEAGSLIGVRRNQSSE